MENNAKIIHKVVVGSQLHGIANEKSDWDYRGIFVHSLRDLVNPFYKVKNTSWIEGDEDDTAYELSEFAKFATKGNATILEILWSNKVEETTPWGEELVANRQKFLDSKMIFEAHRGYAANQYKKMKLFSPDERTPKFAVAYLRVLAQGIQLLTEGTFKPQLDDSIRPFLYQVKYNWSNELIPHLGKMFAAMETKIAEAYYANPTKYTPDYEWIKDFVFRVYKDNLE